MPKSASPSGKRAPPERLLLGLDPGVARTGYAVLALSRRRKARVLACGVFLTPARMPLPERLLLLQEQLVALIATHQPTEAAVEQLFFGRNRRTAIDVAQARGVLLLTLQAHQLPIAEYTPNHVKKAVTQSGRANKGEVGEAVKRLLHLSAIPKPDDAADAAAVALCHALATAWESV